MTYFINKLRQNRKAKAYEIKLLTWINIIYTNSTGNLFRMVWSGSRSALSRYVPVLLNDGQLDLRSTETTSHLQSVPHSSVNKGWDWNGKVTGEFESTEPLLAQEFFPNKTRLGSTSMNSVVSFFVLSNATTI